MDYGFVDKSFMSSVLKRKECAVSTILYIWLGVGVLHSSGAIPEEERVAGVRAGGQIVSHALC
jgi:hypothetical protein